MSTQRKDARLTVNTLPGLQLDGDGNVSCLDNDGRDVSVHIVFKFENLCLRSILRNKVHELLSKPEKVRVAHTKAAWRNGFASSLHSAMISSFSFSTPSFNRNHTRPKSSSFMKPSPT